MKALIIGGSGSLSGELASQLLKNNSTVWTLTRGKRPTLEGVHSLICDRDDIMSFKNTIINSHENWDVVFDCICMNREHALADLDVLSSVTNRLVVVSTDSVYDPARKTVPQSEEGFFINEDVPTSECSYGGNKRRMETIFIDYMSSCNTPIKITIFRPGHIYGKGLKLGCYPECSRSDSLLSQMLNNEPLPLVGLGTYIIQPIYVKDLARVMIDCVNNDHCYNEIFCIGGPQRIENREYYEILARLLNVKVSFKEVSLQGYALSHPEYSGHLCHRCYDLSKLEKTGIKLPSTTLEIGLKDAL